MGKIAVLDYSTEPAEMALSGIGVWDTIDTYFEKFHDLVGVTNALYHSCRACKHHSIYQLYIFQFSIGESLQNVQTSQITRGFE